MTFQFSTAARNASLDAIETAIGPSPILRIRTGAPPTNAAAARSGTVLATMNLPADFMAAASGGSKGLSGTWRADVAKRVQDENRAAMRDPDALLEIIKGLLAEIEVLKAKEN